MGIVQKQSVLKVVQWLLHANEQPVCDSEGVYWFDYQDTVRFGLLFHAEAASADIWACLSSGASKELDIHQKTLLLSELRACAKDSRLMQGHLALEPYAEQVILHKTLDLTQDDEWDLTIWLPLFLEAALHWQRKVAHLLIQIVKACEQGLVMTELPSSSRSSALRRSVKVCLEQGM